VLGDAKPGHKNQEIGQLDYAAIFTRLSHETSSFAIMRYSHDVQEMNAQKSILSAFPHISTREQLDGFDEI
jgi:hypothetical protein